MLSVCYVQGRCQPVVGPVIIQRLRKTFLVELRDPASRQAEGHHYFRQIQRSADGQFVKFLKNNPESANVSDLSAGVYVVKMQNGRVIRNQKMIKK